VSADGEVGRRRGLVSDRGEVAGEPVERLGLVVAEADDDGLEQVESPGGDTLARLRRRQHHLLIRLRSHGRSCQLNPCPRLG
jgi:hypothetical protein